MLRRLGILLVLVLLAAVIGDTVVWFWMAQRMRAGWDNWVAAQRSAGWTITAGTPRAGGWPAAVQLTVPDLSLQGGRAAIPGGVAWDAQRLVLRLGARHPRVLQIALGGAQRLRVSHGPDIPYTAQRLDVLVPLRRSAGALPLHLDGAAIQAGGGDASLAIAALHATVVLHQAAGSGQPAATLAGSAAGITLPGADAWALGRQIGSLSLDATLLGPLPAARTPTQAAAAWRDGGGSIALHRIATNWGPLGLAASGTLRLDAKLQPSGNADAQVTGYGATLDALARHGVMSRSAAMAATAVLSLLAETPLNGGPSAVDVPLSLKDQTLFMQTVPLLRVPMLDWPPA